MLFFQCEAELGAGNCEKKWQSLLMNLSTPPLFTTLRVNTYKYQPQTALNVLNVELGKVLKANREFHLVVNWHDDFSKCFIMSWDSEKHWPHWAQYICKGFFFQFFFATAFVMWRYLSLTVNVGPFVMWGYLLLTVNVGPFVMWR